ncbi:MAG: PAS domain-containing protein [Candidatus Sericytochromatia bacterium]|nr:PAS domain-containing protein [Candidatus Sericytochromatia bacterium]
MLPANLPLDQMLNALSDLLLIFDADQLIYANSAALTVLGLADSRSLPPVLKNFFQAQCQQAAGPSHEARLILPEQPVLVWTFFLIKHTVKPRPSGRGYKV